MNISIIIPTYNASKYLPDLLERLNTQAAKYNEIIIIDSSSTDNTIDIAKSYGAETIIIPKEQFDHGLTRNTAIEKSKGDILVFLTQDALPVDEFSIQNLIRPFSQQDNIAAVYGRQLPSYNASLFSAHLRLFNYTETSYIRCLKDRQIYGFKTIFFSDSFSAYRRNALEKIDWFKNNLIFGEDTHAIARLLFANYKIAYVADASVYHSHNYTALQEFKRYFDIGVFHRTEDWIEKAFGKPKGEGIKFIKSEVLYLMRYKKYNLIPAFILRNVLKYIGYNLGLRYYKIPENLACKISMNKNWWKKNSRNHK